MMNCDLWEDKIDAFVDGELGSEEATRFEQHLRECPACSAETLSRQQLKIETRSAGSAFVPSPAFEARIRGMARARRGPISRLVPLMAVAALVVIAFGVAAVWHQHFVHQQLVAQFVDQHAAMIASNNPVDIVSSDPAAVKSWLSGKVPFSVDLPSFAGSPFTLVGGRLSYVRQAPTAQLLIEARRHRVSVFIFRDTSETASLGNVAMPVTRMGYQTETWVEDGIRYFAISDAPAQSVQQLCELLKQS